MSQVPEEASPKGGLKERAALLLSEHLAKVRSRTDQLFAWLMLVQWGLAILVAVLWSPRAWAGRTLLVDVPFVHTAVALGAVFAFVPITLARLRPGAALTRHAVAVSQALWAALFVHLSGGRIEAHFHVFASLALLALYRDPRVLFSSSAAVLVDLALRGAWWPESVYGVADPGRWRLLEHALWIAALDVVLVYSCRGMWREQREVAVRRVELELAREREGAKARELDRALRELGGFQEHLIRVEKLAAVGQLAASVGHELRNPLAAVRNAHAYLSRKMARDPAGMAEDPRVSQFMGVMERELNACAKIISDLLDFARERPPALQPCPLRPLVDEAIGVVPQREGVRIINGVPESLPVPNLDKEQFRQVLVNLVQNAVEAMPPGRDGVVSVLAEGGEAGPWCVRVVDDGAGIPPDVLPKIFEPLFTTKTRGTGLGLAIVANMVQRHGGTISVRSEAGRGSEFVIQLPASAAAQAA
ncbi:two-component sensor histidine kinase [Pyxidicoccus fallax]|uniref:histidine kinase n=1 Tax=Pyxidicoccus fallax TaxID=394095 RepID=A0A848L7J1_9BACT|nr:ATP-binding protein [Pyxidicoccus fallax]NMO14507.1 two-component sensor histidine kinase [Pyxidicoccus fallax]NPC83679.1 two-component sensor histidine kinase [Pyxidicoccus fallax]